ncbi:hypothetical protein ACFLZ6_01810 [Nanoarchaeota archaeon]
MEKLIEKRKLSISPEFTVKGSGHPMLNMRTDFLKTVDLEDIHMKIACGKIEPEPQVDIQECILTMPEELRKKFVRD